MTWPGKGKRGEEIRIPKIILRTLNKMMIRVERWCDLTYILQWPRTEAGLPVRRLLYKFSQEMMRDCTKLVTLGRTRSSQLLDMF